VRGSSGGGWGFNVPTPDLVGEFETGDPRQTLPSSSEVKLLRRETSSLDR